MSLQIVQFPCLSDNYGYVIRDQASGLVACIDTPDAKAILAALERQGWGLDFIFNTHWHPDHAGGNARLKAETGCEIVGPAVKPTTAPATKPTGPNTKPPDNAPSAASPMRSSARPGEASASVIVSAAIERFMVRLRKARSIMKPNGAAPGSRNGSGRAFF